MPVNLETALALRTKAYRGPGWDKSAEQNLEACKSLGFESWKSMLDQGFNSPDQYIEFLEGRRPGPSASELCDVISRKYGHPNPMAYRCGTHGYKGEFIASSTVLVKANEQLKKIRDAQEEEMKRFQETGEVTLGFKDENLYARIEDLERRLNEFAVHIVLHRDMKERIDEVEEFTSKYKDNMLALEHLLVTLIEQTNIQRADASTDTDDPPLEEDTTNKNGDSYMIYTFAFPFLILAIAILYVIYDDRQRSINLELLDNRPAFGTRMLL